MNTCYTVITNNYDELKPPRIISKSWDYVVFSDRYINCPPWTCVVTDKHNREIKIKADDLYQNLTLYVDGSIEIIGNLNSLVNEVDPVFSLWKHPHRSTVKQEIKAIIKMKGVSKTLAEQQYERYVKEGFRDKDGLFACGVLLRDLSNSKVKKINSLWFNEYINGVHRDQISFPYVCWKLKYKPYSFSKDVFNRYFDWGSHLKK